MREHANNNGLRLPNFWGFLVPQTFFYRNASVRFRALCVIGAVPLRGEVKALSLCLFIARGGYFRLTHFTRKSRRFGSQSIVHNFNRHSFQRKRVPTHCLDHFSGLGKGFFVRPSRALTNLRPSHMLIRLSARSGAVSLRVMKPCSRP